MEICFATNNDNKIKEVKQLLGEQFQLLSLKEIGCTEELAEDQSTLEGNARQKAQYVFENYHVNCFADDTGLEVFALNNEPGVYSARYAGPQRSNKDNINLLLDNLKASPNRGAQFRTVISAFINNKEYTFEGKVEGVITNDQSGNDGFGYDPIFKPNGFDETFAEMSMAQKNMISHRGRAVAKFVEFLKTNFLNAD
jgi:XTP/dITP diphosphohydrolase